MARGPARMVATQDTIYEYHSANGELLFQVVRYEPKRFKQRRPDGKGGFIWNLNGVERVPYRLPQLLRRIADGEMVFVAEGEKDADTLQALGLCATTSAQGAGWLWTPQFVEYFRRAKRVVVIPDCDEGDPAKGSRKGREAARHRADMLRATVGEVILFDLAPDRHDGYDVSDWFADGNTVDELLARVAQVSCVTDAATRGEHAGRLSEVYMESGWIKHDTEQGVADYFNVRHGTDLRYVHVSRSFFCWNGTRWALDTDGATNRIMQGCIRGLTLNALTSGEESMKRIKTALQFETHKKQQAVLALARDMKPIATAVDAFDKDSLLLNVQNGTLNLRTGNLREHRRTDMISKISPVSYRAEAECPRWDEFLLEIFQRDMSLIEYVQRAVGYSLTGESREHVIFLPFGSGANGKSTFIETIAQILGDYAMTTSAETFIGRKDNSATNDLARLHSARFVSAVEGGENKRLSEAFIKSVTGGDLITARFMFKEFFEFRAIFKLWLATNHRPQIRGADDGIWRRIRLIPFNASFAEQDRDRGLREKLQDESPGILAWALRGAVNYLRSGLGDAIAVDEATAEYRSDMDTFGLFLEQCCTLDPTASATMPDLLASYTAWSGKNSEPLVTVGLP